MVINCLTTRVKLLACSSATAITSVQGISEYKLPILIRHLALDLRGRDGRVDQHNTEAVNTIFLKVQRLTQELE